MSGTTFGRSVESKGTLLKREESPRSLIILYMIPELMIMSEADVEETKHGHKMQALQSTFF